MLVFLATLAIALSSTGPSPDAVRKASEQAYKQGSYQTDLPTAAKPETSTAGKKLVRRRNPQQRQENSAPLSLIRVALLWFLVFIVVAVFALWIAREFLGYLPDAEAEIEAAILEDGPANTVVSAPLQDARALAQRGQYGEAIHTLLLRTLKELGRTNTEPLAPSLTSREILEALQLAPAAHDALTGLIAAVELCHFRGSPPTQGDYARCLGHFEVFARAYVQQEAA